MAVKRISLAAKRYAKAAFDLACDASSDSQLKNDMLAMTAMMSESQDLRRFIASARISHQDSSNVVGAIAQKAGFSDVMANSLRLMAVKGRKALIPEFLAALDDIFAQQADLLTAEVTSAFALTAKQTESLKKSLQTMADSQVEVQTIVDENVLGGVKIRIGSTLIDDTVSGKLERLKRSLAA